MILRRHYWIFFAYEESPSWNGRNFVFLLFILILYSIRYNKGTSFEIFLHNPYWLQLMNGLIIVFLMMIFVVWGPRRVSRKV